MLAREDGAIAGRIVQSVLENARPDAFVLHMNVPVILGYEHADILGRLMDATLANRNTDAHVVLVLRSDGEPEIDIWLEMRTRAFADQQPSVRPWNRSSFEAEFLAKPWW